MEERETSRMHKCGESKTTRIMMETVRQRSRTYEISDRLTFIKKSIQ